jgi:DNA-binding CsgD family transcriptional regulator
MGERCDSCGQVIPREAEGRISDQELNVLSAWWLMHSTRTVARFFGRSEQTIKNQLYDARRRHGIHNTSELARLYMGRLRTMEELLAQHNQSQQVAA